MKLHILPSVFLGMDEQEKAFLVASIMTTIELQDKFSTVVYGMIQAANLSISAMYDMREAVSSDMDTRSLEGAKEQLNQATLAANQLKDALRDVETFDIRNAVRGAGRCL